MREFLTPDSIATTIRMLRSTFVGSFLLVEGSTDARLLKRFVDQARCHVQDSFNRDNVLFVVSLLDADRFAGHVGLVDSDFSYVLGEQIDSDNVLMTDEYDFEIVIFKTDVFERFVAEYCNPDKVIALENQKSASLRDILIRSASSVGVIRFLSKRQGWNINFEDMTFHYIKRRDVEIDVDRLIQHLRGRSQGTSMPSGDKVKDEISAAYKNFPTLLYHVCGHDLCEILSKGVHDVFGRTDIGLQRGAKAVEEVFRTAYTLENFKTSSVYAKFQAWQNRQHKFRLL